MAYDWEWKRAGWRERVGLTPFPAPAMAGEEEEGEDEGEDCVEDDGGVLHYRNKVALVVPFCSLWLLALHGQCCFYFYRASTHMHSLTDLSYFLNTFYILKFIKKKLFETYFA